MKKIFFAVMLIFTALVLTATCALGAITTQTDYKSFDFTANTVTNSKASDITGMNYVPKDSEANNPYSGEIVYGAFGKDASDAVFKFTSEWNGSALPTDTSVGTNIKTPFIQFASGGLTTMGDNDIVHVSYDMYIDGSGMSAYGESRPYKPGSSTTNTRFVPTCSYISYSGAGITHSFSESITIVPFKPNQWSRIDLVFDAQATATVDGATVDCAIAYLYVDGVLVKDGIILDGDNTVDGYQTMGGLEHIRFFLNPKAVDGVFPKTSTYLDNLVMRVYRDGTMPTILPEATLTSAYTTGGASVVDNTDNIIVTTGYTNAEFISSLSATDSYTYAYSVVDGNGNAVADSTVILPGYYLRAVNSASSEISYYRFSANPDASITSDELSITDDKIHGYTDLTLSDIMSKITLPYGASYELKTASGTVITDLSQPAAEGMMLTVTAADEENTKVYTFGSAYREISTPTVTSAGYATDGRFTAGAFSASVDVTNFVSSPISAKVIIAQYSAAGRLKAYGMSSVASIADTATLTATMNVKSTAAGDSAKVFVWDSINAPLTDCATLYAITSATNIINTYPTYTTKALTFSFDDGSFGNSTAGDKRTIDIFDKYGIKATWNLVASRINDSFMKNAADDYFGDGDEVANHGYEHRRMSVEGEAQTINGTVFQPMTTDDCKYEIGQGKEVLENLFGVEVNSLIWPYGVPSGRSDYAELVQYIKDLGIKYARPTGVNGSFSFPTDWYDWRQTARIMNPDDYLDSYLALDPLSSELKQFSIWGHAYELTYAQNAAEGEDYYDDMSYDELDVFCKAIYDEGETWFATNMELYDYYTATKELRNENGVLYNDTDIDLYAVIDGQQVKIPAHGIGGRK